MIEEEVAVMSKRDHSDGKIQISDDAIGIIAAVAAMEIPGIAEMSGTMAGEIVEKLGGRNSGKGVKIKRLEDGIALDLYLIVDFGVVIPEVAIEAQRQVKSAVEKLTGMVVVEVNIIIQGIKYQKEHPVDGEELE